MIDDRIKENKCADCGSIKTTEIALRTLQGTVKAQEKRIKELLKENHDLALRSHLANMNKGDTLGLPCPDGSHRVFKCVEVRNGLQGLKGRGISLDDMLNDIRMKEANQHITQMCKDMETEFWSEFIKDTGVPKEFGGVLKEEDKE